MKEKKMDAVNNGITGKGQLEKNVELEYLQREYRKIAGTKERTHPFREAAKIIILYLTVGGLWILLSDKVLAFFVRNQDLFRQIELYKGWFYVLITGLIFFYIIFQTLKLYRTALDSVIDSYEELSATHEEILAMNQELDDRNDTLARQKEELTMSQERYQLVVEGASDGIWDWDLKKKEYFLSKRWKNHLGYEDSEMGNSPFDWKEMIHPDDWVRINVEIDKYTLEDGGFMECIYRIRNKAGEYRWIMSRGKGVWQEEARATRLAGSHTDITDKKILESRLERLAYYSTLTELPNKFLFEKKVEKQLEKREPLCLINLNIDDLKHINDVFGATEGDLCIRHVAGICSEIFADPDVVSHLSGGQFVIMHVMKDGHEEVTGKLNLLLERIRMPWQVEDEILHITASAGVIFSPEEGTDLTVLMRNAEIAMFCQKNKGKNGYTMFQSKMYEDSLKISKMNTQLSTALDNGEFAVYYQPQYELDTEKMVAAEALIRWIHPKKGIISPMDFIPLSEKTGHIIPISIWVMRTVIEQKRAWEKSVGRKLKVAINMSGYVISNEEAVDEICRIIEEMKVQPDEIEFEVTETAVMLNLEKAKESLERIREYGITIAMDDFGSGYSSLTYLHELPLDILKIDKEFIRNIGEEEEESYIYKTVIDLAHNLELRIVAEGVETVEQRDFLRKNHCEIGQGYFYSKPLPAEEMIRKLEED